MRGKKQMAAEERLALRRELSDAWVNEIHRECLALRGRTLPKSALGKAANYTLNQWKKLKRCLDYAEVELSTNGRPYLRQLRTKSGIWFCDLRSSNFSSRPLDGWPSPDGLMAEFMADASLSHAFLDNEPFSYGFPLRGYQRDAIRAVERSIASGRRELLLAMATGTGKTKT